MNVAIAGAGELGGLVAHVLARRDVVRTIHVIDDRGSVAAGKALDIAQAAAIEGFSTVVAGSSDLAKIAGATIVVMADNADGFEWQDDEGLRLITRVHDLNPRAIVVCAGASHRDLVDRAVRERHVARTRIVGSAPEALGAAVRALVALATNTSPRDIALSVLGVPPHHAVVSWEDGSVAGLRLTRVLDNPSRRRIDAQISALWPPGPYALASAAASTIGALAARSRHLSTCFVAPDDSAGERTRTAALPVRLGPAGVIDVVIPHLSVHERVLLDNAIAR